MNPEIFSTKRLELRPITLMDIPSYEKYFIDYEVIRFLSKNVPWPYPKNGIQIFLEEFIFPNLGKDRWFWGICLKSNPNEIIGAIDLWRQGVPEHRGFWLGGKYWGNGFMTEAIQPVNQFSFEQLGFNKLIFSNAKGNYASRKVKKKTGAKFLKLMPAEFVDPIFTKTEIG